MNTTRRPKALNDEELEVRIRGARLVPVPRFYEEAVNEFICVIAKAVNSKPEFVMIQTLSVKSLLLSGNARIFVR